MAILLRAVWGGQQYAFGYLLRIDLVDEAGRIYNHEAQWPTAPSAAQIDAAVVAAIARQEAQLAREAAELNPPAPEPTVRVICQDGTEVLL